MKPRGFLLAVVVVLALLVPACKKKAAGEGAGPAASATVAKATLGPDVKTVEAVVGDPALMKGDLRGQRLKVHGYAVVLNPTKVVISASPTTSIPFVACVGTLPPGVAARAHVVAEGVVDELGQLGSCTIAPL